MNSMEFIVKNGPFIKDKNNKNRIFLTYLLTLIPFLIYRIIDNTINNSILIFISLLSTLLVSVFIDYLRNKKIIFNNYINDISYAIIISLIVPVNTPYILIFILNIILVILNKFIKMINCKAIIVFICTMFLTLNHQNLILSNYNVYIFILLIIISMVILIIKRSIKFRICISFLITLIIGTILTLDINSNTLLLMFSSIYVISEFSVTPNTALIQFLYGALLGILSTILPLQYLFLMVIIFGIVFKFVDRYYLYYLAKNRKQN